MLDTQYRRVLVPLDGSDIADSAIAVAKVIGKTFNSDLSLITVLSPPSHSRQPAKTPVPNLPGIPDPNCVPAHALRYLNDDVSLVPTAREHTLRPSLRLVFRTIDAQICAAEPVEAPSSEPRAMTEWCPSRRNMPDE